MGFFKEFKEFAVKGNMMEMAIGIIIGAAFNKVIDSLVKQVLMPPLSMLSDGINYENRKMVLKEAEIDEAGKIINEEVAVGYGLFLEALLDFFIIGMTVFIVVRFMNRLKNRAQDSKDPTVKTPKDIELLSHISELMEEQNQMLKSKKQ